MILNGINKEIETRRTMPGSRKGFTLVETLISVFIFLFMLTALYAMASISQKYWDVNKVKNELQQEMRKAMDGMIYDLRQAGQSSISDVPADGNGYSTITFKIPNGVSGGSLTWISESIQFVLGGASSKELHRIEGADDRILALNLAGLSFRRPAASPNLLEVSLLGEKATDKGLSVEYNLAFEVQLRN